MYQLIFSNFAMHVTLDAAETELIKDKLQHKTVKKNTTLLHAGHVCRYIYFVNKGCVRIFNTDEDGVEHNILLCPENWWAVDIASFSGQTPAFYTISALEETEVFYLSYTALEQLYKEVPKLERFFRILTQNGFYLYQQRLPPIFQKRQKNVTPCSGSSTPNWSSGSHRNTLPPI